MESLAGEFWVCPEFLFWDGIAGGGRDGAGKSVAAESGEDDLKLLGLKLSGINGLLERELVGEAEFEDGYEPDLDFELRVPTLSTEITFRELESRPVDDLGEKNSSSSPSSSSLFKPTSELG